MLTMTQIRQQFSSRRLTKPPIKSTRFWIFDRFRKRHLRLHQCGLLAALLLLVAPIKSLAAGTWTALASGPPAGVNNCMLMSDGTVLGMNGSGACVKLTPDIHGSYINGTWTTLASMNNSRLFFSSELLT